MKPGFVRRGASQAHEQLGTRPGLHGQVLVSSGLSGLDEVLGGGIPIGSVLLVDEDPYSDHHATLLRYFLAEGVACGQAVLWAASRAPPGGVGGALPRETTADALGDDSRGGGEEAAGAELRIAWQYRRYLKDNKALDERAGGRAGRPAGGVGRPVGGGGAGQGVKTGASREWCHSFDLSKPMGPEALRGKVADFHLFGGRGEDGGRGEGLRGLVARCEELTRRLAPVPGQGLASPGWEPTVGRIAVQSVVSPEWPARMGIAGVGCASGEQGGGGLCPEELELVQSVMALRGLARSTRLVVLLTAPTCLLRPLAASRLQGLCDAVVALESVAEDSPVAALLPEPSHCTGLLRVRRLPMLGALAPPPVQAATYAIRQRRRKLEIGLLHLPPDVEMASSGAPSSPGAASLLCGGAGGASSAGLLDF